MDHNLAVDLTALAVCGEAGAGEAIAPVIARLWARGRLRPEVLASSIAHPVFERLGLAAARLAAWDRVAAEACLAARLPAVLVTGASGPERSELPFVRAARERGIPSVAVLDFWSNYRLRFSRPDGTLELPDRIAVMDERARTEMEAAGFPAPRLVVTGAPHLEAVCATRPAPESVARLRASLALGPAERLIVFLSQPLRRVAAETGVDEQVVLRLLVGALEEVDATRGGRTVVGIKPHPLDEPGQYEGVVSARVRIERLPAGDNAAWLLAADLVVGMNSILILHSCLLGRPVLSFQPGLRGPDVVPSNAGGQSLAVYDPLELRPVLERALLDARSRAAWAERLGRESPPAGAADRVADLIEALCLHR